MTTIPQTAMIPELRKVPKRLHYPLEVMLACVRWYAASPFSFRHLEQMMQERGVFVDHASVHRWASKKSCRSWRSSFDARSVNYDACLDIEPRQLYCPKGQRVSAAAQFYSLAFEIPGHLWPNSLHYTLLRQSPLTSPAIGEPHNRSYLHH